jgi:NTE family protein
MRRALVLAGGGYVASSWEIGLITGMAEAGLDVRNADMFLGTSAGARVALDLASGKALEEFYRMRAGTDLPPLEPSPKVDWARIRVELDDAKKAGGSSAEILRRVGAIALTAAVGKGSDRRQIVATQIPLKDWPEQRVLIVALNAETGERRAFGKESGIDLVDAVIATTAFIGSPPTLFEGQYYIDGGFHSGDNADLAIGFERVLILSLVPPPQAMRQVSLDSAMEALRAAGSRVEVIHPDEDTLAALVPTGGQMNPASGKPAAIAGRVQGRSVSERIASFWR